MSITLVLSAVANHAADGTTMYTGTIGGSTNTYAGGRFVIAGFNEDVNNGTFLCVSSTTNTLVLQNPSGVSENHVATATIAWILACKEISGTTYVTRLSQAEDDHAPGIPDPWHSVGPGSRPSIQAYAGNGLAQTQFILTFEFLGHLFCRVLDIVTWPPSSVNPIAYSGGVWAIGGGASGGNPEDALTLKLASTEATTSNSYYFNPVNIQASALFFDPSDDTFSVTVSLAAGWVPFFLGSATAYYRLYRRPIGSLPWTLVMDWTATSFSFLDSNVGSLRYEYTATWGTGANPLNPNVNTDHNEGVLGSGNIIDVDSNAALDFTVNSLPGDSLNFGVPLTKQSTNAAFFGDPKVQFVVASTDEVISLSNASLENSDLAAPTGGLGDFPEVGVVTGDDSLIPLLAQSPPIAGAVLLQTNANAAHAGMY